MKQLKNFWELKHQYDELTEKYKKDKYEILVEMASTAESTIDKLVSDCDRNAELLADIQGHISYLGYGLENESFDECLDKHSIDELKECIKGIQKDIEDYWNTK